MLRAVVFALGLLACGRHRFDSTADAPSDLACDEPWSAPFPVTTFELADPSLRADGLELFGAFGGELCVATRGSRSEMFGSRVVLPMPPNTSSQETEPSLSDDGLELYFSEYRMGNAFTNRSRRASVDGTFERSEVIGILGGVDISHDGLTLYSSDFQAGIRAQYRASTTMPFGPLVPLPPPVNGGGDNGAPTISRDDLELYFTSDRDGAPQPWVARRPDRASDFATVEKLAIANFASSLDISADDHVLHYRATDARVWAISRCE